LLITAAVVSVLQTVQAPCWLQILAAIAICALGLIGEREKLSEQRRKKEDEEREVDERWLRSVQECLLWPAPPIPDINPCQDLGVARSQLAEGYAADGEFVAPYVARDKDSLVRQRLRSHGSVLLVGTPSSGVTRTAYQAALSLPKSTLALVPVASTGPTKALGELDVLSRFPPETRLLLWLDRVDTFTNTGLTSAMLRHLIDKFPGSRVVATISSTVYEVWATENPALSIEFGDPVVLERLPSVKELQLAEERYPGVDFSEGIAAAFMATAKLLIRLSGGDPSCSFERSGDDCALARTVVDIVIGWTCTDVHRPLSIDRLSVLARDRMVRREIDPDHLGSALRWATAPVGGGMSLLSLEPDVEGGQAVTAHRDIVEVRRAAGADPDKAVWVAALDAAEIAGDSEAVGRIGFRAVSTGNVEISNLAWEKITSYSDPAVKWLHRAAAFSHGKRDFDSELALIERLGVLTLDFAESAYERTSYEFVGTLINLGIEWDTRGQPDKALDLYQQALLIQEQQEADSPAIATTLNLIGNALRQRRQAGRAHHHIERALRIQEQEYGPDHSEVARTLTNLGNVLDMLGQSDKARDAYERALRIQEQEYGPDHSEIAITLTNLGNAWNELGQSDKARELCERALHLKEQEFGLDHPEIARTLVILGNAWSRLNQPAKARDTYERALCIQEREFGLDHPEMAGTLANLGQMSGELGQLGKARELIERALHIQEREFGPNDSEVASTLVDLGIVLAQLNQEDQAREFIERALRIKEQHFGTDHPEVVRAVSALGNLWRIQGHPAKARPFFERALGILHTNFPEGHPFTKIVADHMAAVAPDVVVLDDGQIIRTDIESRPPNS
jgi:tetratricopeptide (TPR) repeat protein